jgi:phage baseplate assembly protein gpV/uncharacterized Zn-binding protein involved in type VI secretion
LERLSKKYPDPRKSHGGIVEFNRREERKAAAPRYGVVSDNKDPLCLGRLRVACDMIAPGAVTGWIPMVRMGAGKGSGWWQLPDIGTQVLLGFVGCCLSEPVVLGCIYDLKHKPPKHSTEKAADSIVYQTKSHRLEIIDEEGKESIILSTAKGQMRYTMTKGKGIEIINELGNIEIKCRKLTVEGGNGTHIVGRKKVRIEVGGAISIHAKKSVKLESEKEIRFKAKNIRLNASRGITTGGKQLAAEGNKVMGFDIHQMVIPSGSGTAVVPLPHPYIGKLVDKVSDNVKINGHNAATKGSVSKHNDAVHNQLPGTIKFQSNPNKEGEVTGGTGKKVKINGKEVAVIGSTVTTCNDIGARDNSVIMAPGASMPMPVIINPKNMEEYRKEREEEESKKPEFTAVRWGKSQVKEGEETELIAEMKDIGDGNMVTFQVWKEGQDPAVHVAQARIAKAVEGGMAKGRFSYRPVDIGDGPPPERDPKFFFSAHSAWCPYKASGNVTVELLRPEITELKWEAITYDEYGNETGRAEVSEIEYGKPAFIVARVKDIEEGGYITIKILDKNNNLSKEKAVKIINGEANLEYTMSLEDEILRNMTDNDEIKIKCFADGNRIKQKEGDIIEVKFSYKLEYLIDKEKKENNDSFTLKSTDGVYNKTLNFSNDIIPDDDYYTLLFTGVLPGKSYTLIFKRENSNDEFIQWEDVPFYYLVKEGRKK